MQTHDITKGREPAIVRLVLRNPEMKSTAIMRELRAEGLGKLLTDLGKEKEARRDVRHVRRIVRLVLAEQALTA
jgi:hypothetical protein